MKSLFYSGKGKGGVDNNKIVKVLAIVITVIGILVTIGWVFGISVLQSISPEWVTMKFSTAVSFVFSGVSLYFMARAKEGKVGLAQIVLPVSGLVIFLFMLTLLASALFGVGTDVENLFIKETAGAIQTTTPGRPSLATIMNFILIIATGPFIMSEYAKFKKVLFPVGLVVTIVGGLGIVGYAANLPVLYYHIEDVSTAMAFHTAILFVMSGAALILLTRQEPELRGAEYVSIRTKLVSLFCIASVIPIIFVGTLSYNIATSFASTDRLENGILVVGSIIIIIVAVFAFITSKSITKPLIELISAANEISRGNLDVDINVKTSDEIEDLASTFNAMKRNIREWIINLQETRKQLMQTDRAKEEFSSMITHELKTPLVAIQGYSELLLDGTLGELTKDQKDKLWVIYDSALSLSQLIQDILDVHRLELGKLTFDMQYIDAKKIIDQCINTFKPIADAKGINLVNGIEQYAVLECDQKRILQVLSNLVSNAIKFVPEHEGRIEICARINNGSVLFSVKDNGSGIPKDKRQNIFKKFYQVDTSLTREAGGAGLGLAISKGIVEAHKGKIWVESEEGRGSTFYFSIPTEVQK